MTFTTTLGACFIVLAVAVCSAAVAEGVEQPVADVQSGRLMGKIIRGKQLPSAVQAFLGIPYAQPPVGDLRLALPEPVTPWEGTRDATEYAAGCPQDEDLLRKVMYPSPIPRTALAEDCLYLDVYTPDVKGKRDVLVMIHGGGFTMGKSSMFEGSGVASYGDIVVVSISYRLGILGFLQNYNGDWPANLGIRDQQFALHWVQDNIAVFGGDPERVTIAGESAGSISVSQHVLSPSSHGLFHRAISQSGSAFSVSSTSKVNLAAVAIPMLGCVDFDADATLKCLRNKSVEDIMAINMPGAMVPNGDTFPKDAAESYSKGDFSDVDLMIGITENEGYTIVEYVIPAIASQEIDEAQYQLQLGMLLHGHFGNNAGKIYREVMKYYFGGDLAGHDPDFIRQQTSDIVGSLILSAPTYLAAQYHSDHNENTFFYRFAYPPSFLSGLRPDWHTGGCDHGFEIMFTMGVAFSEDLFDDEFHVSEEDIHMAKIAVQYWTNFVKTGNPNGEGLVEWKPFTREKEEYLVLKPECEHASAYRPDDMSFWNEKIRGMDKPNDSRDEL